MQILLMIASATFVSAATTCLPGAGDVADWGPDCSAEVDTEDGYSLDLASGACFASVDEFGAIQDNATGCMPTMYAAGLDISKPGCISGTCWCVEDDCNTETWAANFVSSYVLPPRCYFGIAGENAGPTCSNNALYDSLKFEWVNCWGRTASEQCVENNPSIGMGDGCNDYSDKNSCEAYRNGERETDESYDGTTKHCRWVPARTMVEKESECQDDSYCTFFADRNCGSGNCTGSCEGSELANNASSTWQVEKGMDCEKRTKHGCFENNEHLGESDTCTSNADESACLAVTDGCSTGTCTGNATAEGTSCADFSMNEYGCTNEPGCTFEQQCCQWVPEPADLELACATNGAGTADVCDYTDGQGPPSKGIAGAGFEHSLFRKGPEFQGAGCSLVASFRPGYGSATAFGANVPDPIGTNCESTGFWEALGEHIGHDNASIAEYCENFIPDTSAMEALAQHSPGEIIAAAKAGQFPTLFPGLQDNLFLVTSKPEFGECLFTSEQDESGANVFGVAICVCASPECNNQTALELIVDPDVGPMRLLQFIDGSLSEFKDEVNAISPDLLDADGNVNHANVGSITEVDVDKIMLVEGIADLTNKDELWTVIQDYQRLNQFIEDGGDPDDPFGSPVVAPVVAPVDNSDEDDDDDEEADNTVASPVASPVAAIDDVATPVAAPVSTPTALQATDAPIADEVDLSSNGMALAAKTWITLLTVTGISLWNTVYSR